MDINFKKVYGQCFKKQISLFLLELLCQIIDVSLEMSLPFLMAHILDKGVKEQNFTVVWQTALLMFAFALVAIVFGILAMRLSAEISNRFCYELRKKMLHKIQTFSFTNIDHFEIPSLVTRFTSDVNQIRRAVMMSTRAGIKAPLMMIVGSIFMFIFNAKLAAIVLSASLILCVSLVVIILKASPRFKKTQKAIDNVNKVVEEDIDGIRVVKSFVREEFEDKKFDRANSDLKDIARTAFTLANINVPLILLALNICNALILGLGGIDAAKNTGFTSGQLSSFINFSTTVMMSFNMVSGLIMTLSRASASSERVMEIFKEKVDILSKDEEKGLSEIKDGSIEFIDATFSYLNDEKKLAVGPISVKIDSGQIVGIVGSTGSGKTSLVSLIPRLYDSLSGEVLVGGKNVEDYNLVDLRENIGMVTQKNVLFSGTIRENILWGKMDASDEQIDEVLKTAQAYDFVYQFPQKLDTRISQGATNISGGQKQRLAIARALIKKPRILILDDSTSAVDLTTEAKLKEAFYRDLKGTTILIIAQRISSVKHADKILVLDNGKLESIGTHEELLKVSKVYQEIYETQKKGLIE